MRLGHIPEWMLRAYVRFGSRAKLPRILNFVGGEPFEELGRGHFQNVSAIAKLRPDDRVLDVGCGVGRVAQHFVDVLGPDGSYDGFDAARLGIAWCNTRIAPKHPNFRFVHLDVRNRQYNPGGRLDAATVRFPYEDGRFSLVYATSVLTHLLPGAAAHYLREVARVLKPDGRCLVTFFVINAEAQSRMGESPLRFQPRPGGYWSTQPDNPEAAVGYDEAAVLDMYARVGLVITPHIHYGDWSGRIGSVGGQDHILAVKA
jgi:SAM-dependent methyltransferase